MSRRLGVPRHAARRAEVAACVSFYLLIWSPLFWSFGRVILGTYADDNDVDGAAADTSAVSKMVQQVKKILSPPVIGSILGVVVGGVPILQRAFFGGGIATPLTGALQKLGRGDAPSFRCFTFSVTLLPFTATVSISRPTSFANPSII
jgi:hypothetical protein